MSETVTIIHLSDLHLADPGPWRPEFWEKPKRALAWRAWSRKKAGRHDHTVLNAAAEAIEQLEADSVVITGDFVQLALPEEFEQVREWLPRLGDPARVTIVPGNHDSTAAEPWEKSLGHLTEWLAAPVGSKPFPSLRKKKGVALIGASSACPTLPGLATGKLGKDQLDQIEKTLEDLGRQGVFRVLFLHHPAVPGVVSWRKRLTDAGKLRKILDRQGVELLLHGHTHSEVRRRVEFAGATIASIGAPSVSEYEPDRSRGGSFHVYTLTQESRQWNGTMTVHRWSPTREAFVAESPRPLVPRS